MGHLDMMTVEALLPGHHRSLLWGVCVVFAALAIYARRPRKQVYTNAPIACVDDCSLPEARERFRTDARRMLQDGYEKYKGKPFYVPSPLGERLMLPPQYVEELKTAPVHEVDFVGTFYEMFEGRYTTMGSRSTLHPRTAKHQLNQHLEDTLYPVNEEIEDSFNFHLPKTKDWKETQIANTIVQIVARVSSRMFGGIDLSRDDRWVSSTIDFAVDGFIGAQAIKKYPHFIRPLVAHFIPALQRIKQHCRTAKQVIVPILEKRATQKDEVKPSDFLQWMVDNAKGEETDNDFLASIQLKLSFAAIHTSAAAPAQILYDLCARPEYIQPLRDEIEEVIAQHGQSWTKQSLRRLIKLDSFMKESQRFNPLLLITFERIITRDYVLDDSFYIPAGTQIGVPTQAISMDPDIYGPDAHKFDGFRFAKLRNSSAKDPKSARMIYAASNLESMAFGYGRHACPGRYFAELEIKMIMVHILRNYEFKFAPRITGRPASLIVETQCLPNHDVPIMLREKASHNSFLGVALAQE